MDSEKKENLFTIKAIAMLQMRQTYACPKNIMKWKSRDQVWDKNQGL
jgi:hypothetical protein